MHSEKANDTHDASARGQDDVAELTRRKELDDPLLHVAELHVVPRVDAAGLVQSAGELNDDLAAAVVVDLLKGTDVVFSR
jgi:hypothetical protein